MAKIGFLGAGKMGGAIIEALLLNGLVKPQEVWACEAVGERRAELRRRLKIGTGTDPVEVAGQCDVLFLAVKPQELEGVLATLSPVLLRRHLLISIAAGKRLEWLRRLVGAKPRLARVMPNLAVMVGEGMSAYCLEAQATKRDRNLVRRLLAACGEACELAEEHFDVVTALGGSGPAFYAYIARALAEAAGDMGLPEAAAQMIAQQTMLGTATYLQEMQVDPGDFIKAVASPQGTTEAGLAVLERSALATILRRTLAAAAKRSRVLA